MDDNANTIASIVIYIACYMLAGANYSFTGSVESSVGVSSLPEESLLTVDCEEVECPCGTMCFYDYYFN